MYLSNPQLECEFRRQLYLCSGLGVVRMREILEEQARNGWHRYVCPTCGRQGSFATGHICKAPEER